jgi:hypothetical protein
MAREPEGSKHSAALVGEQQSLDQSVCMPTCLVLANDGPEVGNGDPDDAARGKHTPALEEKLACLRAREMLEHV